MPNSKRSPAPFIAVAGGAGYLGRCIMDLLLARGYAPLCLDNYSTGHRFEDARIPCWEVDLTDLAATEAVWTKLPPLSGVIHFAAKALVGESTEQPYAYFKNNLLCTLNLAELASRSGVSLIHSSSCAVYGVPESVPISETNALAPISPYGETKRVSEQILAQFSQSHGLRCLNLRYFNPAGALAAATHGECHTPETHLIPNVLKAAQTGEPVSVFGDLYSTPDGSCVRDFLHVEDLAEGHLHALEFLNRQANGFCDAVNLGSGKGRSVFEILKSAETVVGKPIPRKIQPARAGDPPHLVAAITKAEALFGWKPKHDLESILKSHWQWAIQTKSDMTQSERVEGE